jgi:hypothetical protein
VSDVRLTVHRATNQIGGNCIEIATGDHRIVLDVGRPLDAPSDATGLLPTTLDLKAPMDSVLSWRSAKRQQKSKALANRKMIDFSFISPNVVC